MASVKNLTSQPAHFLGSTSSIALSWEELVDAGPYFQRIAELMEDARESVVITGWQVDSRLPMPRPVRPGQPPHGGRETFREKVLRLCDANPGLHFYFLVWDHATFYVVERELFQNRIWEGVHPQVHFVFDNRHPYGGSHHEKVIVIDRKVALVGGVDLCDERWDSPLHHYSDPRRSLDWKSETHEPYHDLTVQVTGPVVSSILQHLNYRWSLLTTIPFPEALLDGSDESELQASGKRVYVSSTRAEIDPGIQGHILTREIERIWLHIISQAEKQMIFEGQYWWSKRINDAILKRMKEVSGLQITIVLADVFSLKGLVSYMGFHQYPLLIELARTARATGNRLRLGTPWVSAPTGGKSKAVYVHSKLVIIDDRYISIGSANFASRGLRVDTELQLTLEARSEAEHQHIQRVAEATLAHWSLGQTRRLSHMRLRPIHPEQELRRLKKRSPWAISLPWAPMFDPKVPWFYFIKRRYHFLEHRRRWIIALLALGAALMSAAVATRLAGVQDSQMVTGYPWPKIYAAFFANAWWLPLPVLPLSLISALHLGGELAARISVTGFLVSALMAYSLGRAFPSSAARFYRNTQPWRIPSRLQARNFPYILSIILDFRVSVRSKLAFQGIQAVPVVWFVFSTCMAFGSLIYLLTRGFGLIMPHLIQLRPQTLEWISVIALTGCCAFGAAQLFKTPTRRPNRYPGQTGRK